MYSDQQRAKILPIQPSTHSLQRLFTGSFCVLNVASTIKENVNFEEGNRGETSNSVSNANLGKNLAQTEFAVKENQSKRKADVIPAVNKRRVNRTVSDPTKQNKIYQKNTNYFLPATPPDSPTFTKQSHDADTNNKFLPETSQKINGASSTKFVSPKSAKYSQFSPSTSPSHEAITTTHALGNELKERFRRNCNKCKTSGSFKCRFCDKIFTFQCHLQVHERVSIVCLGLYCKICSACFRGFV